jgi:hypothetical protein
MILILFKQNFDSMIEQRCFRQYYNFEYESHRKSLYSNTSLYHFSSYHFPSYQKTSKSGSSWWRCILTSTWRSPRTARSTRRRGRRCDLEWCNYKIDKIHFEFSLRGDKIHNIKLSRKVVNTHWLWGIRFWHVQNSRI